MASSFVYGYIVPEWGDTDRIDPVYSVAKNFVSTLASIAVNGGMMKSADPMKSYAKGRWLASPHNAKITWENHLQQTSEWEG